MALNAAEFLEIVERDHQVPAAVLSMLRQQVAAAARPVAAATLAKYLVDKKHMQPDVVRRILAAGEAQAKPPRADLIEATQDTAAHVSPVQPVAKPQPVPEPEEELGLAPDDEFDDEPRAKPGPSAKPASPISPVVAVAQPVAGRPQTAVPVPRAQTFTEDDLGLAPDDTESSKPKPSIAVGKAVVKPVAVTAVTPVGAVTPATVASSETSPRPATVKAVNPPQAKRPAPAKPAPAKPAASTGAKPTAGSKKPAVLKANRPMSATTDILTELTEPLVEIKDGGEGLLADITGMSLESLAGQDALSANPFDAAAPLSAAAKPRPDRRLSGKHNGLIIGGATAAVVLALTAILVVNSSRSNGEPEFASAEKDYEAGANQAAADKFREFLDRFSRHPRASVARVHLGVSRFRMAMAQEHDWPDSLPKVRQILEPIVGQSEFQPARAEVAALLTRIAETLTDSAAKAANPQEARLRLASAREALRLADDRRFVPSDLRDDQLLRDAAERLTLLEYNLDRSDTLEATLAAMTKALAAHDLAAAYAARKELVDRYPDQARMRGLLELGNGLAAESLRQVTAANESRDAATQELPVATTATLVLTGAPPKTTPAGQIVPCFALVRGTVYALDALTGRILWRRYVGGNTDRLPVPIDDGADVLLVDARDHSLLRVNATTGKLRWRLVVGQPLLEPALAGDRVFVATRAGLILSLDAASGHSDRQAQLPQSLALPLVAAADGLAIYALAEHSHLYTLATADLACGKVTYLGHEPGMIEVPPLVSPKHLLVAENRGEADSVLRVFSRHREGPAEQEVQSIPLAGQVVSPPAVDARHVAIGTAAGPTYVFELTERADAPLKKLAEIPANRASRLVRYLALHDGRLWIADAGLRSFAMATLAARAKPAWQGFATDALLQPLQIRQNLVIAARRASESSGVLFSAVAAGGGEPEWETRLGVPPVIPWMSKDGNSLLVPRVDGNIYQVDVAAARGLVRCQPLAVPRDEKSEANSGSNGRITDCLPLGDDQALMFHGAVSASIVDLSAPAIRPYALPGVPLCSPVSAAGGVFAVCQPGEVYFLGAGGGQQKVEPFMPLVRPADRPAWHLASATASGEPPLAIAVRGKQLYGLAVRTEPIPHLATLGMAELTAPPDAPPAVADKLVCVADRVGNLQTYVLPELKGGPTWSLGAPVAWGPQAVGAMIVASTDDGHLHVFDAKEQRSRWKIKLAHPPVVGACVRGEQLFVASRDGILSRFSLESGAEEGIQDLGEPLGEGLLCAGPTMIVVSGEGSLLKVPAP